MGKVDRPKITIRTGEPAEKVVLFQQDTSYYIQKGSYYHQKNKLSKALLFFRKAIEMEPQNALSHYNLACLLSKTSRLEEANRIFAHVVQNLDSRMTECYFLMAINYGLMEDLDSAKKYLQKYIEMSPEGEMAEEARELVMTLEDDEDEYPVIIENLTAQETEELIQILRSLANEELLRRFDEDELFHRTLLWGLYQGNDRLKQEVIRLFGRMRIGQTCSYLKQYVLNPWIKERLRQAALLELKNIDPEGNCRIYSKGRFTEINLADYPLAAPVWREDWQEVLNCTLDNMSRNAYYGEEFYEDVQAIWLDFINHVYPNMPRIVKPQAWGAALEYSLARFHFLNLTQKELADNYGVSAASVGQKFRSINEVLHIDQKAYRNMLAFLAHKDRER